MPLPIHTTKHYATFEENCFLVFPLILGPQYHPPQYVLLIRLCRGSCSLYVETSPAQTHSCPPNNVQSFSASVVTIASLTSDNSRIPQELVQVDTRSCPLVPLLLGSWPRWTHGLVHWYHCSCPPSTFLISAHTLGHFLLNAVPVILIIQLDLGVSSRLRLEVRKTQTLVFLSYK